MYLHNSDLFSKENLPEGVQLTILSCSAFELHHSIWAEDVIFLGNSQTMMEQGGGSRVGPLCLRQEENLFIWVPIRFLKTFSELYRSVNFFLCYSSSCSFLFPGVQLALPTPVSISHCLTQSLTLINLLNLQLCPGVWCLEGIQEQVQIWFFLRKRLAEQH